MLIRDGKAAYHSDSSWPLDGPPSHIAWQQTMIRWLMVGLGGGVTSSVGDTLVSDIWVCEVQGESVTSGSEDRKISHEWKGTSQNVLIF